MSIAGMSKLLQLRVRTCSTITGTNDLASHTAGMDEQATLAGKLVALDEDHCVYGATCSASRGTTGAAFLAAMGMALQLSCHPAANGAFHGHGAEHQDEAPHRPATDEAAMRDKTVKADRDAHGRYRVETAT